MPSIRYLMVRSAKGASRTTHDGCAAPSLRPEANSFTCSFAGETINDRDYRESFTRSCAGMTALVAGRHGRARSVAFSPRISSAGIRLPGSPLKKGVDHQDEPDDDD